MTLLVSLLPYDSCGEPTSLLRVPFYGCPMDLQCPIKAVTVNQSITNAYYIMHMHLFVCRGRRYALQE